MSGGSSGLREEVVLGPSSKSKAGDVNLEAHLRTLGLAIPTGGRYLQAHGMCGKNTSMLIFSLSPRDLST